MCVAAILHIFHSLCKTGAAVEGTARFGSLKDNSVGRAQIMATKRQLSTSMIKKCQASIG